jgi:hypothetical protein
MKKIFVVLFFLSHTYLFPRDVWIDYLSSNTSVQNIWVELGIGIGTFGNSIEVSLNTEINSIVYSGLLGYSNSFFIQSHTETPNEASYFAFLVGKKKKQEHVSVLGKLGIGYAKGKKKTRGCPS